MPSLSENVDALAGALGADVRGLLGKFNGATSNPRDPDGTKLVTAAGTTALGGEIDEINSRAGLIENYIEASDNGDHALAIMRAFADGKYTLTSQLGDVLLNSPVDIGTQNSYKPRSIILPISTLTHQHAGFAFTFDRCVGSTIRAHSVFFGNGSGHLFDGSGEFLWGTIEFGFVRNPGSVSRSLYYLRDRPASTIKPALYASQIVAKRVSTNSTPDGALVNGAPLIDIDTTNSAVSLFVADLGLVHGYANAPIIKSICRNPGGSRHSRNVWRVRGAEVAKGGIVHLSGEIKSEIFAGSYDLGTPVDSAIVLGGALGAADCKGVKIDYNRQSGDLPIGVFDVKLIDAQRTELCIQGHNAGSSKMLVDCGGTTVEAKQSDFVEYTNESQLSVPLAGIPKWSLDLANVSGAFPVGSTCIDAEGTYRIATDSRGERTNDQTASTSISVSSGLGSFQSSTPERMIDGTVGNGQVGAWAANATLADIAGESIEIDYGSAVLLTNLRSLNVSALGGNWRAEGSNDNVTWDALATEAWAQNAEWSFESNRTPYRYLRLFGVSGALSNQFVQGLYPTVVSQIGDPTDRPSDYDGTTFRSWRRIDKPPIFDAGGVAFASVALPPLIDEAASLDYTLIVDNIAAAEGERTTRRLHPEKRVLGGVETLQWADEAGVS